MPSLTNHFGSIERSEEMPVGRTIEIFSAGCPLCLEAIDQVLTHIASPADAVVTRDIYDCNVLKAAKRLGIRRVPAIVVDGRLACCSDATLDEALLREADIDIATLF